MSRIYENPLAPPDYESEGEPDIQFYMPLDPRMQQFMVDHNFVSLFDLLDETLLQTPPDSEEETEIKKEKTQETKGVEMQQNTITLEKPETLDSLNAFIAEFKNKSIISEKEVKGRKRQKKKKSKHRKRSEKSSKSSSKHKNKSSCRSSRSTSQSSSSSTERLTKHHNSTTLDKSPIHVKSPNHRSVSPQQSTSRYKSRSSKRSASPCDRLSSRQQYSSSRISTIRSPPSRSPSPNRLSSSRRYTSPSNRSRSHHYSSSRKANIRTSRSPSSTRSSSPQRRTPPSRSSHSYHYSSSSRAHIPTLSRSPSPARSPSPRRRISPSRRSSSHYYSSSRKERGTFSRTPSPVRLSSTRGMSPSRRSHSDYYSRSRKARLSPARSPSFERLPSRYKLSNNERPSNQCSSRRNKSPSYQRSQSPCEPHIRSPERSSRHKKSNEKSSKPSASSYRSPQRQQSLSPRRSPRRYDSPDKSSNIPKLSVDENSKVCKSPNDKSSTRQRKFPIEDDYTRILAEEMKKRQIWDGSDFEEEGEVIEFDTVTDAATKTPIKIESADQTKDLSEKEQNLVDKELKIINDDESQSKSRLPKTKFLKQEIKSESLDQKGFFLNSFYCSSCQLSLNSEATWQSHINGKKHAKILKLQTVHEVAKGSIAVASTSSFVSEDAPRFNNPPPGKIHRVIMDTPRIQSFIDSEENHCLPGMDLISEIRSEKDVTYYCSMCDSPCSAHSIMPHLIGYKHQLNFLKRIEPEIYERNQSRSRKDYHSQLSRILAQYERKFGRGRMQVVEECDDSGSRSTSEAYSLPGSSWRNNPQIEQERNAEDNSVIPPNDECLDTSKSDFYCKLCDAHMNNMNMWESHVRGKRHLRNAKKIPGENISKVRSIKAPPDVASNLEKLIQEHAADEIIVGLDSIRETQGPNGENYTCFPCGSNCTNYDIIDHLLLSKHKIRYLEKLITDGKTNGITTISQMEIHDDYFRKHLINDECLKMMEKYGSGTPEVYITKN